MSDPELIVYIEEYQREGLGTQLYNLIHAVVSRGVRRYPAQHYSPDKAWTEEVIDQLATNFVIKRLKPAKLEHFLYTLESVSALRNILRREFRQFLINQAARTEWINIHRRVKYILRNDNRFHLIQERDPFELSKCVFRGKGTQPEVQRLQIVLQALFSYKLPRLTHHQGDKKTSPILSNPDLGNLLAHTLSTLDAPLSVWILMDGLQYRLGLLEIEDVSIDDQITLGEGNEDFTFEDILSSSENVEDEVVAKEIAETVFTRLTERQRKIFTLRWFSASETLEEIGKQLNISKSTVENEIKVITNHVKRVDPTLSEIGKMLSYLHTLCLTDHDQQD
jgi:RNA polymerase sigma factor (sigma-70 family)